MKKVDSKRMRDRGSIAAGLLGFLTVIVLVALIVVGGYQLGWWLKKDAVNRDSRIQQNSYGRQNALVEQIYDDIKDAETAGIPPAQRKAIVSQVCDSFNKVTGSIQLSSSAVAFISREC